jgi:hypothetical protein
VPQAGSAMISARRRRTTLAINPTAAAHANNYFSLAVFRPDDAGQYRRQKARFHTLHSVNGAGLILLIGEGVVTVLSARQATGSRFGNGCVAVIFGKRRDDAGWYELHPDGIRAESFGDCPHRAFCILAGGYWPRSDPDRESEHRATVTTIQGRREAVGAQSRTRCASQNAAGG